MISEIDNEYPGAIVSKKCRVRVSDYLERKKSRGSNSPANPPADRRWSDVFSDKLSLPCSELAKSRKIS
jgi:hypothetical protein